ncbi:C-type lectin domain family 4 member M-like [Asterias amurensis]|uniref:C-type lectin domain family 4 member M-like n=1 Tax=Asterias amurensis TaxID=7602 RepID=UPI003AB35407
MPPTWSQWQDKCYNVHDTNATWEEGKQICVELGRVMVVPQSEEELQHLVNMSSCQWFWIGCNDLEVEGTWVCHDGEGTFDEQDKRWEDGQPRSVGGNENCAAGRLSGWFDIPCDYEDPVMLMCQRPVSKAL